MGRNIGNETRIGINNTRRGSGLLGIGSRGRGTNAYSRRADGWKEVPGLTH